MTSDLLSALRAAFDQAVVHRAAAHFGEPVAHVHAGLDAVLPLTLAGIVRRVDTGATDQVAALATEATRRTHVMDLAGQFGGEHGGVPAGAPALITGIFGERFGAIANAVSARTGLKGATTSALFGAAVPYALALLGRAIESGHVAPAGLAALLAPTRRALASAVPGGYDLRALFGIPAAPRRAAAAAPPSRGATMALPLLAALGIGGLAWWMSQSPGVAAMAAPAPVVRTDTVVAVRTDTVRVAAVPTKLTLRNGVVLDATAGGIEELLLAFLDDSAATPGNDNWFDFSELNFEFGTATIVPSSRREVDNLVRILQEYPAARIKIGGYTDRVGAEPANLALSQARADAVAAALRAAGVGAQVVGAEGYGSQFARFPASAPEVDRLRDRHVSVSVRAK